MATLADTDTGSQEIRQRYLKLYTGAIADMLDKNGYRRQVLPYYVTPFTTVNRLAGPAFTGQGYPCADTRNDDTQTRLDMLDSITPGSVSVWACGGSLECAHWGEIMSTAARERGCTGAVIDGGVRDVDFINDMQYPVFARFKSSASSIGRSWRRPSTRWGTAGSPVPSRSRARFFSRTRRASCRSTLPSCDRSH